MQLHLNPSYKGNQSDMFVTQCVSDLICPHTYRWYRIHTVTLNQHLGTNLLNYFCIVIFKIKLIRLFIISTSVVRAKRAGVSLFNLIFVLKEGQITLLLFILNITIQK
jgi:hypothetical protein